MKKLLLASLITLALAVPVMAEPIAEFDTDNGHMIIQTYEVGAEDDDTYLYVIFDWTNNGSEIMDPLDDCLFTAFQNGKEIDSNTGWDTLPDNTDGYFGTQVMPGYTTTGYLGFELDGNSEVIIHAFYFGDEYAEFTINPGEAAPELDVPEETPVSDEPDAPTVGEKIAELEARIDELEARVAELEG